VLNRSVVVVPVERATDVARIVRVANSRKRLMNHVRVVSIAQLFETRFGCTIHSNMNGTRMLCGLHDVLRVLRLVLRQCLRHLQRRNRWEFPLVASPSRFRM